MDAAGEAGESRRNGIDPLTLRVLAGHAPAGQTLLELVPPPETFSASALRAYEACPTQWAFSTLYRIPTDETKGHFEFGTNIHDAYEKYARARLDAAAAGQPAPGYDVLKAAFDETWQPRAYADEVSADGYRQRAEPALRRFYERELESLSEAVGIEEGFTFELRDPEAGETVRFRGYIDRIDRAPDGSIEIVDYKTGRAKSQAQVDADEQLSVYALALKKGAVVDKRTGQPLPPASRLALYFTESDQKIVTTRSDEQLTAFEQRLWATVRRIRSGDFTATPSQKACGWCGFRRICPSWFGSDRVV